MSSTDAARLLRAGEPPALTLAPARTAEPADPASAASAAPPAPDLRACVTWLAERRRRAVVGDEVATRKRHDGGRLTARERVLLLLDEGTFM